MPWCVQDDTDRDQDRSIPKSPQQPSSGRKPPCQPPPVQESCTWMGKRRGAKKNKGGDVTGHCYYYYYYYYIHRVKEISYRFNVIFSFLSNSCLPLRVRPSIPRHSSSYFNIFYRGEQKGHTQRGV